MKCTWKDCNEEGKNLQIAKDGLIWSRLCDGHVQVLNQALASGIAKNVLGAWAKARHKNFLVGL